MRGVVCKGPRQLALEEVEDPRPEAPTDVVLRLTSTAICGTDLHIYEGRMGEFKDQLIGHEPIGIVEEVGPGVLSLKRGDRITVPTHIYCGFCLNCQHAANAACLTVNPPGVGGAYGYPGMGPYAGCQAERVRIPFADANAVRLPGEPGDRWEHDFLMLADALPTAYHATELAQVGPGDVVAIYGAGAVGLLAAHCALSLRGAAEVYVVDNVPERLEKAGELGATPINFTEGNPAEQIREMVARRRKTAGIAYRGEEAMGGVDCGIDAIGFQARAFDSPGHEQPAGVIDDLARLLNPTGRLGIIGVFPEKDPHSEAGDQAREGQLAVPWGLLFKKGVRIGLGRDQDMRYNRFLRDLIVAGRLRPGSIVSHRLPLAEAPDAYARFDRRADGYVKVVLDLSR